jgi:hypothetical protein
MMRRCTSGPKPSARVLLVHVEQVLGFCSARWPNLHAVEAAQVAADLGRGDDVVDRDRQLGARQLHLDELGAELLELGQPARTAR